MSPKDFLSASERKIVVFPNEILTTPANKVEDFTEWEEVCRIMVDLMRANSGIGLAAVQVGLPFRLFVTDATPKSPFYFNPEIIDTGRGESSLGTEGCLSLPNQLFKVNRYKKVKVRWQTLTGKLCTQMYEGYPARVLQHEIDHLNGTLINRFERFVK